MSRRLKSLARLAHKEALKGSKFGNIHRHGAVILAGNRILSKACNNYKNWCHAEVRAIKRIPRQIRHRATTLIVVRAARGKKYGLSRPCPDCQKAIRQTNIKKIYYTTDNGTLGYESIA